MHESKWRAGAASWMRERWPKEIFIEESYTPYGSKTLGDRHGQPDILRISSDGGIHLVEVKRWANPDLEKWKVLGQLQFYTFLIDSQYFQDNDDFRWMFSLIKRGLTDQATINAIEHRFKERKPIVESWCVVVAEGQKDVIERDDRFWHMHAYVNLNLDSNSCFRPMTYLEVTQRGSNFYCDELTSWFWREDEDDT